MAIIVKGRNAVVSPAVKAYLEKKIDKVTRQFKAVGDITAVLKVENGEIVELKPKAPAVFNEMLDRPITDYPLSVRALNCLKSADIRYLMSNGNIFRHSVFTKTA